MHINNSRVIMKTSLIIFFSFDSFFPLFNWLFLVFNWLLLALNQLFFFIFNRLFRCQLLSQQSIVFSFNRLFRYLLPSQHGIRATNGLHILVIVLGSHSWLQLKVTCCLRFLLSFVVSPNLVVGICWSCLRSWVSPIRLLILIILFTYIPRTP